MKLLKGTCLLILIQHERFIKDAFVWEKVSICIVAEGHNFKSSFGQVSSIVILAPAVLCRQNSEAVKKIEGIMMERNLSCLRLGQKMSYALKGLGRFLLSKIFVIFVQGDYRAETARLRQGWPTNCHRAKWEAPHLEIIFHPCYPGSPLFSHARQRFCKSLFTLASYWSNLYSLKQA